MAFNSDRQRCAARIESLPVLDPVNLQPWNPLQTCNHSFQKLAFMLVNRLIGSLDCPPAGRRLGPRPAAYISQILNARSNAGDAFVIERAPLPAIRNCICVRTYFVR